MTRIVLFDGICVFCNNSVNFIIRNDPKGKFRFVAMQSEKGQETLRQNGLPADFIDSIVLVENGRVFTHSTAALRVARELRGAWPVCYAFIVLPRFLRDWAYGLVAKNRYSLFGKKDACMVPTAAVRARFL